jgi:hypothetical protein
MKRLVKRVVTAKNTVAKAGGCCCSGCVAQCLEIFPATGDDLTLDQCLKVFGEPEIEEKRDLLDVLRRVYGKKDKQGDE